MVLRIKTAHQQSKEDYSASNFVKDFVAGQRETHDYNFANFESSKNLNPAGMDFYSIMMYKHGDDNASTSKLIFEKASPSTRKELDSFMFGLKAMSENYFPEDKEVRMKASILDAYAFYVGISPDNEPKVISASHR